jgi:hypothetical protein
MRNGGILRGPSPNDPDVAVRIDSLDPVDAMSWDNSVPIHPGNMAIISWPMQSEPKAKSWTLAFFRRGGGESNVIDRRIRG